MWVLMIKFSVIFGKSILLLCETYQNKLRGVCGIAMSLQSCATLTLSGVLHYKDKQTTSAHSHTIDITHTLRQHCWARGGEEVLLLRNLKNYYAKSRNIVATTTEKCLKVK